MNEGLILPPSRRSHKTVSRRGMVIGGAIAGISTALGFNVLTAGKGIAMPASNSNNDAKILNNALYYEHQAIWAYSVAAGKLSDTDVGRAVNSHLAP